MSIYKRITQLIAKEKMSNQQFIREVNLSRSSISKMEAAPNSISSATIYKILTRFPNLNIDWLFTARGKMFVQDEEEMRLQPAKFIPPGSVVSEQEIDYGIAVPCKDIAAAAGHGCFNDGIIEDEDAPMYLPISMLQRHARYMRIRNEGCSMEPTLRDNGFLLIRHIDRERWNSIASNRIYVVVSADGHAYTKRVVNRLVSDGTLLCKSDNKDKRTYPDFLVSFSDIVSIWHVEYYMSSNLEAYNEAVQDDIDDLRMQLAELREHIGMGKNRR